MKSFDLVRSALSNCAVVALLAGCGGSQPPIGAPGSTEYATAAPQAHFKPRSSYIYVWEVNWADVAVVTYPALKIVRRLNVAGWICTDPRTGNIYVSNGGNVFEYAPGGTAQIGITGLPYGYSGHGCAVDPRTGDVTVVGQKWQGSPKIGAVLVYSSLTNSPTAYGDPNVTSFDFAGFDDKGNLFIDDATNLTELPNGQTNFTAIQIHPHRLGGTVQWDGKDITVEAAYHHMAIYRVAVDGSKGKIIGITELGIYRRFHEFLPSWIYDGVVIAPFGTDKLNKDVGFWNYPQGGKTPSQTFGTFHYIWSVAAGKS